MNEINLARTIIAKRKEKGLTQDDLASFIGVSKAAISKWETGHSYPDIVLLPQLAAFFNISIDDLMGYEPQMTSADIRRLYKELSIQFTQQPFEEVMARCREITKKYFSCFPLLFQMGALYINYGYYTIPHEDESKKADIVAEAKELFVRVKEQAQEVDLRAMAHHLEALCELLTGNPEGVIATLEDAKTNVHLSNEVLLAQAYQMIGKTNEAKKELQGSIFDSITGLFGSATAYMGICTHEPEHFDEICKRMVTTTQIWGIDKMIPAAILPLYLTGASGYLAHNETDKALDMLEAYTNLAANGIFPLLAHADSFFNLVDFAQEEDLTFGTSDMPRDEDTIKQSIVDSIVNNPALAALHDHPRFKSIANKIKHTLGGK